jgi:hypothetical protein
VYVDTPNVPELTANFATLKQSRTPAVAPFASTFAEAGSCISTTRSTDLPTCSSWLGPPSWAKGYRNSKVPAFTALTAVLKP